MSTPNDICMTCSDKRSNHEGRLHPFANTLEEVGLPVKEKEPQQAQRLNLASLLSNPLSMGRLVEVLIEHKLIHPAEGLYIMGVGTKPDPELVKEIL